MLKYVTTAIALKCFSATPMTRHLYRRLGNSVGNRRRRTGRMPDYYVDRLRRMLRLVRQHDLLRDGDRVLELGTGWVHWEAVSLALFHDIEAVLFDVWDNRQLDGLKNYVGQLKPVLPTLPDVRPSRLRRASALIDRIMAAESFEELYQVCSFTYVVDSSGSLKQFADSEFDVVVSAGVLEHVKRDALYDLIPETHRLLKNGGWVLHSIDTSDHLAHYDVNESKKQYLTFSERTWHLFLENEVQYINRLQKSEWLQLFRAAHFAVVDEQTTCIPLNGMKLATRYVAMPARDAECTVLRVALRK